MWVNSDECARKEKQRVTESDMERLWSNTKHNLTQKGLSGELDMDYLDATSLKHRHHIKVGKDGEEE